jgi:hypothetical protein
MNSKTTPKDFFYHAGAAIALFASVIALMNLAFAVINKVYPDALDGFFAANSIVWPVSVLIVLVPVLYVVEWFIFRDIVKMPEKKEIWVRKWRIYTTLFLTALTLAGDLIVTINVYLNGETTERFIWKVVAVFVVSALVFAYYLLSRIGSIEGRVKAWRVVLAWIGAVLVFGTVVGGFIIIGSPAKQRAIRFDHQRVNDIANIQYQVFYYWQQNGKLPLSLQVLGDGMPSSFVPPTDPETGAGYQYTVLPSVQQDNQIMPEFEVCTDFDGSSSDDPSSGTNYVYDTTDGDPAGWSNFNYHPGLNCFVRTINPTLQSNPTGEEK